MASGEGRETNSKYLECLSTTLLEIGLRKTGIGTHHAECNLF